MSILPSPFCSHPSAMTTWWPMRRWSYLLWTLLPFSANQIIITSWFPPSISFYILLMHIHISDKDLFSSFVLFYSSTATRLYYFDLCVSSSKRTKKKVSNFIISLYLSNNASFYILYKYNVVLRVKPSWWKSTKNPTICIT